MRTLHPVWERLSWSSTSRHTTSELMAAARIDDESVVNTTRSPSIT